MAEFKLIVAGGRDFNDYDLFTNAIKTLCLNGELKNEDVSIVSGMARGADAMAVQFAHDNHVQLYKFHADWNGPLGKGAGFARNADMGKFADGLLAFWDGNSKGTKHMIDYMRSLDKRVWVVIYPVQ